MDGKGINVLLTAVGRRAYLVDYFKQALHPDGGRVYAVNTTPDATGFMAADEARVVPPSSSPGYVDCLIDLCGRWKIKLLFSLHDWDAPAIAREAGRFEAAGVIPVMGSAGLLGTCLDKYETGRAMEKLGVRTPETVLTLDGAQSLADAFGYPLIVKPRWGQGSVGLFKVHSREELEAAFSLASSAAGRFAAACPEIDPGAPQVMVQRCVAGGEYGCDIVNDLQGRFRRAFVKRKFAMRSGETDAAESVMDPALESMASKVGEWSRHRGCMDSDWMVDSKGAAYLIELNPRFGGGYPFTHMAGGNIVKACIDWARGIDDGSWCAGFRAGVRTFKEISLLRAEDV